MRGLQYRSNRWRLHLPPGHEAEEVEEESMTEPDRIDEILADDKMIDDLIKSGDLPDDWDKL